MLSSSQQIAAWGLRAALALGGAPPEDGEVEPVPAPVDPMLVPISPIDAPVADEAEGPRREPSPGRADGDLRTLADLPPELARKARRKGIGLGVGAGVAGLVGIGALLPRISTRISCYRDVEGTSDDPNLDSAADALQSCFGAFVAGGFFGTIQIMANGAAFGLAAGAGAVSGRGLSMRDQLDDLPARNKVPELAIGATLMAGGIVGWGILRVESLVSFWGATRCAANDFDCATASVVGYMAGLEVMQAASIVGVGLLAHGAAYRRESENGSIRWLRRNARITPWLGLDVAGVQVGGRF